MLQEVEGAEQLELPWKFKFERAPKIPDADPAEIVVGTHGDRILAPHRAAVWGLVAAGDAAVPLLLEMIGSHEHPMGVLRAAFALTHAVETPSAELIAALAEGMRWQRSAIDTSDETFPSLEQAQKEWRVFASPEYMDRCRQPAWMALEVLAQALWSIARESVRSGSHAACAAAAVVAVEFSELAPDLPPRARMNAAYTLLSLAKHDWPEEDPACEKMVAQLGALAADDNDRYVCAAAVEGIRRIAAKRDPPGMVEAGRRLVQARFCPVTAASTPW